MDLNATLDHDTSLVKVSWKVLTTNQNSSCTKASTLTLISPFRVISKTYNIDHGSQGLQHSPNRYQPRTKTFFFYTDGEVTIKQEQPLELFDYGKVQVRVDVIGGDGFADNYITTTVDFPLSGNVCDAYKKNNNFMIAVFMHQFY